MDDGALLDEAMRNLPCELELSSWNEAVSVQARLKRHIKGIEEVYAFTPEIESPFKDLQMIVIRPGTLRFQLRSSKLKPARGSAAPKEPQP